ncbi:hypothetical protein Gotur_000282 [Gossypium turneri]
MHRMIGGRVGYRLCLKLKNLEHRALILNSKRSWNKCSWGLLQQVIKHGHLLLVHSVVIFFRMLTTKYLK